MRRAVIGIGSVLAAIVRSSVVLGMPANVVVTVTDPNGQGVESASVLIGFDVTAAPLDRATTNSDGQATLTIEVPNQPMSHGWVVVTAGAREEESGFAAIRRWKQLVDEFQFPGRGTPFSVVLGQQSVNVAVQASGTIEVSGVVSGGGAGSLGQLITGVGGLPAISGSRADGAGGFSIRVARSWPLLTANGPSWGRFVSPEIPSQALSVDLGPVDLDPPLGRLVGQVNSADELDAGSQICFAMRTDGTFVRPLFYDGDGRLDDDVSAPGPDPSDPEAGIELPAGDYVLLMLPRDLLVSSQLVVYQVVTDGQNLVGFNLLPRVVVPENEQATVSFDAEECRTATKAIIDALYAP